MSSLHIINSPSANLWREMARAITADDAIVVIENGVYALQNPALQQYFANQACYAIAADLKARSITSHSATSIDYPAFVELCAQFDKTMSWL